MGFSEAALLGFVLLLSGANLCAATQNWFNFSTNENQIPQEQVTSSLQLPRSLHLSNWTLHGVQPRSAVTYRLRIYQLRNTAAQKQKPPQHTFQNPLTPEQLEPELLKLIPGPNLNPPVKQESQVLAFEQRVPVPADSVAALCGEGEVTVEVKQDFFGNGRLIRPSDLTLGGCAARDTPQHVMQFHTELHGCGSTTAMTEEALIYSFSLKYSPTLVGNTSILKTNRAEVVIQCHYQRRHYASSSAVKPTWMPFASNVLAEQQLHFSLRLMTEDWQSQRPSSVYFLSDMMHIEAAVLQGRHVPLRVYVDSCVATVNPDPNSQPRHPFIRNYGCFSDAKLTGSKSYFIQRSQEDKLHFQLKAFKFHQDHRNSLYITCHLQATEVSVPIDTQRKACSFLTEANRWVASGGDNKLCDCCETSCSQHRGKRSLAAGADLHWEGTASLGPVLLEEPAELSEPRCLLQTHAVIPAASFPSVALLCAVGAVLAVVLLVFMGVIVCSRRYKPTGHFVCT